MVGACVGTRMPKLFTVLSDPPKQTTWRILIWRDVFNQSIIKFAFLLLKLFDNDSLDRLKCSSSESSMLARNFHVVQTESPVCLRWSRLSEEIPILQLQNIAHHLEVTWSHHHMNPIWPIITTQSDVSWYLYSYNDESYQKKHLASNQVKPEGPWLSNVSHGHFKSLNWTIYLPGN